MAFPKPDYMTIKQTSRDQRMPIEVIKWFIDAGYLDAYVPTPRDDSDLCDDGEITFCYARAKEPEAGMPKWEGRLLKFKYLEILNQDGKISKTVPASHIFLFDEVMISTIEISELVSGFNKNKSTIPVLKPIIGKQVCSKCFTPISDNTVKNGVSSYPEPEFISLIDTAKFQKLHFEHVLWFVEVGHLNAYVPTPTEYIVCSDNRQITHQYARAKEIKMREWKSEYGLLEYNQLEILTLTGETDKVALVPNSLTLYEEVMISTEELAALRNNHCNINLPRTGKEFLLETTKYADKLKEVGLSDEEAALKVKSKYPKITNSRIGRLFPANPGKEISEEGYRKRGKELLKSIKN